MGKLFASIFIICSLCTPLLSAPPCESRADQTPTCEINKYQYLWGNSPGNGTWKNTPKPINPLVAFSNMNRQGRGRYIGRPFHILPLKPQYAGQFVYFRIFSDWMNIGIGGPVEIGAEKLFIKNIIKADLDRFFMGLLMVLLAFLSLVLFASNRQMKILLYLAILALSSGLFALSGHATRIKQLLYNDPEFWNIIAYPTLYFLSVGLLLFIRELFRQTLHKTLFGLALIHMVACPVLLILKIFFDVPFYHVNVPFLYLIFWKFL